jgi:hypothetical protein
MALDRSLMDWWGEAERSPLAPGFVQQHETGTVGAAPAVRIRAEVTNLSYGRDRSEMPCRRTPKLATPW